MATAFSGRCARVPFPDEIARLAVGHLQLQGRAATAADSFGTIGAVASACQDGELAGRSPGGLHVRRVLSLAAAAIQNHGLAGWDHFRKTRPPFVAADRIYFYSPRLHQVQGSLRDGSLPKLHLSRRAINALQAGGIATIGSLIISAERGIVHLRAIGQLTALEITEALEALATALDAEGAVDWIAYAERRQFRILPHRRQTHYSGREFLWHFPSVCEAAVGSKLGAQGVFVLQRRIFRHPDIALPLTEVGKQLGITGERVRLVERSILEMLTRAIWQEEYSGCRFRLRREFLQPLYDLAHRVQTAPYGALTAGVWRVLLEDCWQLQPADLGLQSALLLQLLGIEGELPEDVPEAVRSRTSADALRRASAELRQLFATNGGKAFSLGEISQHLAASMGEHALDEQAIVALLQSLPSIERDAATGQYRVCLKDLRNHVDRAERILREQGTPMHFREIHAQISRTAPVALNGLSPRDLASRMANADRFVPIGRTGVWSLREWPHVRTGTVADIAAEFLATSAEPLSEGALFELIKPLRQVRRGSIGTLLREDRRFCRVAPAVWALAQNVNAEAPASGAEATGEGDDRLARSRQG